tara:strand:+ start:272 stop:562 length:291 start_codon:yes stop_codon:yes gene_type:complete
MQNLPLEIVNNILIIQYEEQISQLKRDFKKLQFNYNNIEHLHEIKDHYLTSHEVKYCEECNIYGDDDEIILSEQFGCQYLCEYCTEFREEQLAINS